MSLNHIVFIVLDSCRHDSFVAANTPNVDRLGAAQKRYSYASWTAPSHHTFAMEVESGRLLRLDVADTPVIREWNVVSRTDRPMTPALDALANFGLRQRLLLVFLAGALVALNLIEHFPQRIFHAPSSFARALSFQADSISARSSWSGRSLRSM